MEPPGGGKAPNLIRNHSEQSGVISHRTPVLREEVDSPVSCGLHRKAGCCSGRDALARGKRLGYLQR